MCLILPSDIGFEGHEFYFQSYPSLTGRSFSEVAFCFADGVPVGLKRPSSTGVGGGQLILNPPGDRLMEPGDQILILALDDTITRLQPAEPVPIRHDLLRLPQLAAEPPMAELCLFCGWRRDIGDMILLQDDFVSRGRESHISHPVSHCSL